MRVADGSQKDLPLTILIHFGVRIQTGEKIEPKINVLAKRKVYKEKMPSGIANQKIRYVFYKTSLVGIIFRLAGSH